MQSAEEFLAQKHLFQLGDLPTETPHPLTRELSHWSRTDLPRAIETLRQVDLEALRQVESQFRELTPFFEAVHSTLSSGGRVFLAGCGATGRLSLSLEYLWRRSHPHRDQVFGFMAGGDVALVHSLEGFEDHPTYGARHLREMNFADGDLLVAITEGGETPYVIGVVEEAERLSKRPPFFLYCNTKQILIDKVERSRRVLTHPRIQSICLAVGPMALTGSTRMQASTVLMLVVGLALESHGDVLGAQVALRHWISWLELQTWHQLADFVESEADVYKAGGHTLYVSTSAAITVLTDTTERAPTFHLPSFDNPRALTDRRALTYVMIPNARSVDEAWRILLARGPRPLRWGEVHLKATPEYLLGFDFSAAALEFRKSLYHDLNPEPFHVECDQQTLHWKFIQREWSLILPQQSHLLDHLTLKMLLNIHSTLVMGRLGRFEGNLMTWVNPSNGKLVDRAARYTEILMRERGLGPFPYDEIVRAQFLAKPLLREGESIVHKTIEVLVGR